MWRYLIEDATLISELLSNEACSSHSRQSETRPEGVGDRQPSGALGCSHNSTNMAGRGTDILLGSNAALTAGSRLRERPAVMRCWNRWQGALISCR